MADFEVEFGVGGLQDFRNVIRVLGREDRNISGKALKVVNKEAKVVAKAAAAKAMTIPAKGTEGHTGLRRDIAKGVKVVPTDSGALVQTSMPESDEAIIPRGMDSDKGWRHPVFGNREVWRGTQKNPGKFSWFMDTMKDAQLPISDGLMKILDDAADAIDRAGSG